MTSPSTDRQCGRCRETFAVDTTGEADPPPKWWLCGPCRLAFFGASPRRNL